MLDSFAVTSKFSRTQVIVLRLSIVLAAIAIAVYNFISTCSPYYATTYSGNCAKTLLPSGSQFFYERFRMTSLSQLDYDGFHPQNCSAYNVAIQESFATKYVPSFKIYMHIRCNDDVDLSVLDFTFKFWHEHYQDIIKSAERLKYYKKDPAQPNQPFSTVEFKHNWLYGDDNSLRLFNDDGDLVIDPTDKTVDREFFYTMMKSALSEIEKTPFPGVKYLCNHCGVNAAWTDKHSALIWKLIFNTANTVGTVFALIVFLLTLCIKDSLYDLLPKNKDQNKEEMVPLVKMEP